MNATARNTTAAQDAPAVLTMGADLSHAVKAIEAAYRMIQRRHRDLPNVTIVVKRDSRAWGHTTVAQVWSAAKAQTADRYEIMISGENLARGAQSVAATLLHEAAHAANLAAGVLDTDVNGRHSRKFADRAELHGLTVAQLGWHGWTDTTLTDDQAKAWAQVIATIDRGLMKSAKAHQPTLVPVPGTGRGKTAPTVGPVPPRKRGNRNLIKAVCPCGDSIRASQGVLDRCQPTCEVCGDVFAAV